MKFSAPILILGALISAGLCLQTGRSRSLDGRIVGGFPVAIEEVPYQASLQFFGIHICGGVIISSTFVLTACHCTIDYESSYLTVRVGSTLNYEGGDVHKVAQIINNPNYNVKTMDYDAALLRLATNITLDNITKRAIILPFFREPVILNTRILVSGWGNTMNNDEDSSSLRAVVLSVSDQRVCHKTYIADGGITARMFCALTPDKDSCDGDSGGPARRMYDGKLAGIVSFGPAYDCANPEIPGVYTNIAYIRPWIKSMTRV